jgi:hypothetical protein
MDRLLVGSTWTSQFIDGRKRPLYYQHSNGILVLGHYESPCGGCDTIGSARAVYDLIQTLSAPVILCEGLLLSEDVKWSSQLKDLRVLYLVTPLNQCLAWIKSRRASVGNEKPLNPANTANRVSVIERSRVKLGSLGIYCRRCTVGQAPGIVLSWIDKSLTAKG